MPASLSLDFAIRRRLEELRTEAAALERVRAVLADRIGPPFRVGRPRRRRQVNGQARPTTHHGSRKLVQLPGPRPPGETLTDSHPRPLAI